MGMWQYLAVLPFNYIGTEMLWKTYANLNFVSAELEGYSLDKLHTLGRLFYQDKYLLHSVNRVKKLFLQTLMKRCPFFKVKQSNPSFWSLLNPCHQTVRRKKEFKTTTKIDFCLNF